MLRYLLKRLACSCRPSSASPSSPSPSSACCPAIRSCCMAGEHGVMSPERYAQILARARLRPADLVQYFDYLGGVLPGDFGISHRHQAAGPRRVPDAVSRDARTVALRHASSPSCSAFRPASSPRSSAAVLVRPDDHGHGAHRLFDADLLVGPAAHHLLFRHPRLDAGLGPHLAASTSSRRSPASC